MNNEARIWHGGAGIPVHALVHAGHGRVEVWRSDCGVGEMNNDLISRTELLELLPKDDVILSFDVRKVVCNAPAVDAEVVRHGKYGFVGPHIGSTYSPYAEHGTCNVCKERILIAPQHKNYCPNCGAKMDAEVEG